MLSSDLIVFFPAALYFVWVYRRVFVGGGVRDRDGGSVLWLLAMILLNPCLILIDHGHFQVEFLSKMLQIEMFLLSRYRQCNS